eukprot:10152530-Lingulodinium_polyedra.AAC.1
MQVLLQSLKEVLVEKSGSFLEAAGQRPILLSYSNDGTPVKARHHMPVSGIKGVMEKTFRTGLKTVEAL